MGIISLIQQAQVAVPERLRLSRRTVSSREITLTEELLSDLRLLASTVQISLLPHLPRISSQSRGPLAERLDQARVEWGTSRERRGTLVAALRTQVTFARSYTETHLQPANLL